MLNISLACTGNPSNPWDWSGITNSIHTQLTELGHDPVWLDAQPNGPLFAPLRRAVSLSWLAAATANRSEASLTADAHRLAELGASAAVLKSAAVTARRRSSNAPRHVVQLRGDFQPGWGTKTVIFEDSTVAQVARHGFWGFDKPLPDRLVRRRISDQRRAHRRAVASCATSNWVADAICDEYGVPREQVHIVGMGAQTLVDDPPRGWDVPEFLWIGLDWERKGGANVLRAFEAVRQHHESAQLHLVGDHPNVDAPGVRGYGRLDRQKTPERSLLVSLLSRSTCFVMPSTLEPAGIVHLEAGLAAIPSIGTSAGGAATIIGPGGLLVDPGDSRSLVAAMLRFCNPATARGTGQLAYAHALHFTWEKVTQRLVRALDSAAADRLGYCGFLD